MVANFCHLIVSLLRGRNNDNYRTFAFVIIEKTIILVKYSRYFIFSPAK